MWLSDQHKQEAKSFNIQKHLAQRRATFSNEVDKLEKLAQSFVDHVI